MKIYQILKAKWDKRFEIKELGMGKYVKRIPYKIKGYSWYITIDDGYVAYRYPLNASGSYSIDSLYRKISKSIKKKSKKKV